MLRDLWRGEESWRAGELERETEVSGRAHKTRQAKAPPALPSLRAARLPLPATPTTLSVFRRTHHTFTVHKGLHMTVDGWRPRISTYLSELPFTTVFLHKTSSPTALISASQQRR